MRKKIKTGDENTTIKSLVLFFKQIKHQLTIKAKGFELHYILS